VGSGIAGVVYGTIVAMATLAAAYPTVKDPWKLDLIVLSTSLVLWIAHVYSHGLAESLERRRRLDSPELHAIVLRELGILLATLPPTLMLVLGAAEVIKEDNAVWLAFGVGLFTLGAQGFRYARVEGFGLTGTLTAVSLNLGLGLLVVALKVSVSH
jgi:hypothetical protein